MLNQANRMTLHKTTRRILFYKFTSLELDGKLMMSSSCTKTENIFFSIMFYVRYISSAQPV